MDESKSESDTTFPNTAPLSPSELILFHPLTVLPRRRPWGVATIAVALILGSVIGYYSLAGIARAFAVSPMLIGVLLLKANYRLLVQRGT